MLPSSASVSFSHAMAKDMRTIRYLLVSFKISVIHPPIALRVQDQEWVLLNANVSPMRNDKKKAD